MKHEMSKWELARYLIDAKKCVDSVLFVAKNKEHIKNLPLRQILEDRQREFYINVKVIYDYSFNPKERKELAIKDKIYKETCYERDKRYAHKDSDYVFSMCKTIMEIARTMKQRLGHCLKLCRKSLPEVITLNYVDYDKTLYRTINHIDPEKEVELLKKQHPSYETTNKKENSCNQTIKVFNDTIEIQNVKNVNNYCVIWNCGLTIRERIQESQDAAIKTNVLYKLDIWPVPVWDEIEKMKKLIKDHPELPYLY